MADSVVVAPEAPAVASEKISLADDPKMVETIQSRLDAAQIDDDEVIETPVEKPVETPAAEVETPAVEADGDEPTEAVVEVKPTEVAPETSTLPEAYRRTAKAREWTDAEIDRFYKQDPALAIQTLSKMHDSRVKEISEWATIGRAARQQQVVPTAVQVPAAASVQTPPILAPINIEAMIEKHGNEELIRDLVGPLNLAIQYVQPLVHQAQQTQQQAAQTAREQVGTVVQGFFTAKEMEPFKDMYGSDLASLKPVQFQARSQVLELADALIAGARMQGRSFTVEDALRAAHDSVSHGQVEKIVRERLKGAVKERERGITLRPSHTGIKPGSGAPANRQELESRSRDRLREVFG